MNASKIRFWVVLFVAAVAAVIAITVVISLREGSVAREIKESQIENCEKNGNPLREVLQKRIHHEVEQTEDKDLIEKFFSNSDLTHEELEQFIAHKVKELRKEKLEVKPIDCAEEYK